MLLLKHPCVAKEPSSMELTAVWETRMQLTETQWLKHKYADVQMINFNNIYNFFLRIYIPKLCVHWHFITWLHIKLAKIFAKSLLWNPKLVPKLWPNLITMYKFLKVKEQRTPVQHAINKLQLINTHTSLNIDPFWDTDIVQWSPQCSNPKNLKFFRSKTFNLKQFLPGTLSLIHTNSKIPKR